MAVQLNLHNIAYQYRIALALGNSEIPFSKLEYTIDAIMGNRMKTFCAWNICIDGTNDFRFRRPQTPITYIIKVVDTPPHGVIIIPQSYASVGPAYLGLWHNAISLSCASIRTRKSWKWSKIQLDFLCLYERKSQSAYNVAHDMGKPNPRTNRMK